MGILALIIALGVYGFAYVSFLKNNTRSAITAIIFAGFILRVFMASDPFLHHWDERYHALVAKHLIETPFTPRLYAEALLDYDYRAWNRNYIWLHKQPLPMWTMALSMKCFGVNLWALRLPSVLLSTIAIGLTFLIGKRLFDCKIGLLAAFFISINGLVLELTGGRITTDHTDIFFFFFITLGGYFAIAAKDKKTTLYTILTGLATGFALLCKWLPGLIVVGIYLVWHLDEKWFRRILQTSSVFLVALVVALPWQWYTSTYFPQEFMHETGYNLIHFTKGVEGHGHPWWAHISHARIIWNEGIYFAFLWFVYLLWKKKLAQNYLVIAVWMIIPYLFFSLAATKMQAYLLPTATAIFIMLALFSEALVHWENKYVKHLGKILFGVLVLLAFRYGIERMKPLKDNTAIIAKTEQIKSWQMEIGDKKVLIFNMPAAIETMFFTNALAYEKRPTTQEIKIVQEKGYEIWIANPSDLSDHLKKAAIKTINW